MANLAGTYTLKSWWMRGETRVPPGTPVRLSHEDAELALAQGLATKVEEPVAAQAKQADGASATGDAPPAAAEQSPKADVKPAKK